MGAAGTGLGTGADGGGRLGGEKFVGAVNVSTPDRNRHGGVGVSAMDQGCVVTKEVVISLDDDPR